MDFIGTTLGNYKIDRRLGEGGMGAVYHAYDISLQREVAIKLVHPHLARQQGFRDRFIHEARIMAHLDHPGIVRVYHLGVEKDLLYLPMEFIHGGNLRQLLDRLPAEGKWLTLHEATLLVQQLCHTVEYAHQKGVLHRDIKPANLMLKPEPTDGLPFRVILTDLGLAKLAEGLGLTQEGTSLGTPAYMSPEQALGQPTDPRSDVYSLGILLYELVVGRLPFAIRTLTEATRYHTQVQPPSPCSINPNVPETMERVILKALEKDPSKRYPSAAALGAVLAASLSPSTEIAEPGDRDVTSLITEYQKSVIESRQPGHPGPMTMFEDRSVSPRGESVFAGNSITPGPETRIQVVHKEHTAQVFSLHSGTVTIGREPGNSIVLDDNKASRKHAQVSWDGLSYYVMDLNSRNGTFLENTRLLPGVSEVWRPDQVLRIGDTWLRLLPPASRAPSMVKGASSGASTYAYTSSTAGNIGLLVTPQQLSVEPGSSVTGTISLLNQSPNVDQFSLVITGIPRNWIASLPASVDLMPGDHKEVVFTLLIPRTWQSRAGRHSMSIKVTSQRDPSQFVETKLTLTVGAFSQFKVELQPTRLQAGRTGRMLISNQGNTSENFAIEMKDREEALDFRFAQKQLAVPEGKSTTAEYVAQLRRPYWFGIQKTYPITVQVKTAQSEPQVYPAEIVSRPLLPMWVVPVMLFLCLVLGAGGVLGRAMLGQSAAQATQTAVALTQSDSNLTATATWLGQDDDRDGLTNGTELGLNTLPGQRDTDADGLDDGQENNTYHTDPLDADSDGDGLKDGDEVSKGLNASQTDTDGDGILDPQDAAPGSTSTPTADAAATAQADAAKTATAQEAFNQASNQTATAIAIGTQSAVNTTNTQQAANATATEQVLACFIDQWVPTNPDDGLSQLNVARVTQNTFSFHGFSQCSPSACDWGEIQVPLSYPKLVGTFQLGNRSTRVTIECLPNHQLSAEVFDDYTAADGRTDRTSFYTLKKKLNIVLPPFRVTFEAPVLSP